MQFHNNFRLDDIEERQIDTFLGICKGLIADGEINKAEADFLQTWMAQNTTMIKNPLLSDLFKRLSFILKSDSFEPDEALELFDTLKRFTGEFSDVGEVAKPTALPINIPEPKIHFEESYFLCTGTFSYGTRNNCNDMIRAQGGYIAKNVIQGLDYLVIGDYVTESWKHESFGRKIENALYFQKKGFPIKIITEKHLFSSI